MKARTHATTERDNYDRINESYALKLMALGNTTPERERHLARRCRLPVAELRRRAAAQRSS
jgi:hypothetical protein